MTVITVVYGNKEKEAFCFNLEAKAKKFKRDISSDPDVLNIIEQEVDIDTPVADLTVGQLQALLDSRYDKREYQPPIDWHTPY